MFRGHKISKAVCDECSAMIRYGRKPLEELLDQARDFGGESQAREGVE
jgi:hypothetical protein